MMNKGFIILLFLGVVALILMPVALSFCGLNETHLSMENMGGSCAANWDFSHLSFMRGLLIFGLVASVLILAVSLIGYRLAVPVSLFQTVQHFKLKFAFLRQKFLASIFKPFDQLALAYAGGLVQPKIFSPVF